MICFNQNINIHKIKIKIIEFITKKKNTKQHIQNMIIFTKSDKQKKQELHIHIKIYIFNLKIYMLIYFVNKIYLHIHKSAVIYI